VNFYISLEKRDRSRYPCNRTTDLCKIWHDDAKRASEMRRFLKKNIFLNPNVVRDILPKISGVRGILFAAPCMRRDKVSAIGLYYNSKLAKSRACVTAVANCNAAEPYIAETPLLRLVLYSLYELQYTRSTKSNGFRTDEHVYPIYLRT